MPGLLEEAASHPQQQGQLPTALPRSKVCVMSLVLGPVPALDDASQGSLYLEEIRKGMG